MFQKIVRNDGVGSLVAYKGGLYDWHPAPKFESPFAGS
jgi:hypothetical protein